MAAARVADPYRILGIERGANDAQIKAAHRRLAKRFHPDAHAGDTLRFLSVQEAYKLLSDPLARREWDTSHAPGPVRADQPAQRRSASRPAPARSTAAAPSTDSAAGDAPSENGPRGAEPGRRRRAPDASWATGPSGLDTDVYDRSSGAAWSMAARAYFRRGDDDLPRRGSFRHAGAIPLTAARARAAAEQERQPDRRPAAGTTSGGDERVRRRRHGLLASLLARLRSQMSP